jgi:hypothetical protein
MYTFNYKMFGSTAAETCGQGGEIDTKQVNIHCERLLEG